jgi:hypothetical protein
MRETVKSLKDQLSKKDAEIEQLKRELKIVTEFYELWKRIAQPEQPVVVPLVNPVYPYPIYPGPTWTTSCTDNMPLQLGAYVC